MLNILRYLNNSMKVIGLRGFPGSLVDQGRLLIQVGLPLCGICHCWWTVTDLCHLSLLVDSDRLSCHLSLLVESVRLSCHLSLLVDSVRLSCHLSLLVDSVRL